MEKVNSNGRIYPKGIFVKAVQYLKGSYKTSKRKDKIKSIFNG